MNAKRPALGRALRGCLGELPTVPLAVSFGGGDGMSNSQFRIAFEGAAFDDGEMDVRDLAPALLALGDVIQAANRTLNGKRTEASLKMRATNRGSFEALLSIDVSFLASIGSLLDAISDNPDRIVAAKDLVDLVIGGTTIAVATGTAAWAGVLQALKLLKGKAPDTVEARPDGSAVIVHNHVSIVVDKRVLSLLDDIPTRAAVEKFGTVALRIPGVEAVRLEDASGEELAPQAVRLVKNDLPALAVPAPAAIVPTTEITERDALLKIVTLAFRDGYKWRFSDGGEKPFTAEVEDLAFLNEVMGGKVSLAANDTLRCVIREEQTLDGDGLRKETKVVRVIEHIPGPTQLRMF